MRRCMQWIGVCLGAIVLGWVPDLAFGQTQKRYTQAEIDALIVQEEAKKVEEEQKKDSELQKYRAAEEALKKKKEAGKCKDATIPWTTKVCTNTCVLSKPKFSCKKKIAGKCVLKIPDGMECVKRADVCVPKPTTKKLELCIKPYQGKPTLHIDGKRDPVLPALRSVASELEKAYNALEDEVEKGAKLIASQAKKRAEDVAEAAKKAYRKAVAEFKAKAEALAKQMAQMDEWKRRLLTRMASTAASKLYDAAKMAKSKAATELLDVLKSQKDMTAVRNTMYVKKTGAAALKAYGKTALISIGIIVAFQAFRITYTCWTDAGDAKKTCLTKELATGMRDLIFDVVGALIQTAIDLQVIEPVSHTLAAAVAAALAAGTAGIGAVSYPIAYGAASLALNLVIVVIYEVALRPEYNKLFDEKLRADVEQFTASFVSALPADALKCWGPGCK